MAKHLRETPHRSQAQLALPEDLRKRILIQELACLHTGLGMPMTSGVGWAANIPMENTMRSRSSTKDDEPNV
jgi:hypothetical protein